MRVRYQEILYDIKYSPYIVGTMLSHNKAILIPLNNIS